MRACVRACVCACVRVSVRAQVSLTNLCVSGALATTLQIENARYRAPEVLFNPEIIGEECEGARCVLLLPAVTHTHTHTLTHSLTPSLTPFTLTYSLTHTLARAPCDVNGSVPALLCGPDFLNAACLLAIGVHKVLTYSIQKSDLDLRRALYQGIVLSGGSTRFEVTHALQSGEARPWCCPWRFLVVVEPKFEHGVFDSRLLVAVASLHKLARERGWRSQIAPLRVSHTCAVCCCCCRALGSGC